MSSMVYEFGEYRLEAGRRTLLDSDGKPIAVTAKAFDALCYLVERHGELVEREALRAALWPNVVVEDNNLNQAIGALRRVLGDGFVATVPGRGYQFVAEVKTFPVTNEDSDTRVSSPAQYADTPQPRHRALAIIVFTAVALVIAAYAYLTTRPPASPDMVDIAAALEMPRPIEPNTLAVLPFSDLSPGRDQGQIADGLADELITQLGSVEPLRVTARTSSFAFRDSGADVTSIAAALGVAHVLEGSVASEDAQLLVRARLVDATTGFSIWSETYESDLADVLTVQKDIAGAVAEALRGPLGLDEPIRALGGTDEFEAYALYLAARSNTVTLVDSVERGLEQIDGALAIDPEFALAWAQKALLLEYRHLMQNVRDSADLRASEEAAARAIEIEPELYVAHSLIASARAHRGSFLEAEQAYRRTLSDRPRTNGRYAILLLAVGHVERARRELDRAVRLDPLGEAVSAFLAGAHDSLGYTSQSLDEFERARRLFPVRVTGIYNEVITRIGIGEIESINALREIYPDDEPTWDLLEETFSRFTEEPRLAAETIREGSLEEGNRIYLLVAAALAARFGEPELALEIFAPTVREISALQSHVLWRPAFRGLRRLPEFNQLMREEGFLDYWLAYGWPDFCRPLENDDFECF